MTTTDETLRLGTRASALAVRQAEWVAAELYALRPGLRIEIERIRTSGDRVQDRPLAEVGGKGLFVKEIEEALLAGRIDVAVHSMKDLPAALAPGLDIAAVPRREDPRDFLVGVPRGGLAALRSGARVGTSSLRRAAFVRHARSDVEIVALRGNVDTRIAKWRTGEVDALILARAGLARLGIEVEGEVLSVAEMVPAIGQGALAVESRPGSRWWSLARSLDDPKAATETGAERAFLRRLGGDCATPLAAHATLLGADLEIVGAVGDPDGRRLVRGRRSGPTSDGERLALDLADELLSAGAREILAEIRA